MNAQGSQILNTAYFDNLIAKINNAPSCAALAEYAEEALENVFSQNAALNAELAKLAPLIALLTIPTDLGKILTWVSDFITNYLAVQLKPYITLVAQVAMLAAKITELEQAIQAAKARFTTCEFDLPVAPAIPPLPPLPPLPPILGG